jgi:hypothetical protein
MVLWDGGLCGVMLCLVFFIIFLVTRKIPEVGTFRKEDFVSPKEAKKLWENVMANELEITIIDNKWKSNIFKYSGHHRVFPRTTLESAMFVNVEKQGVRRTALIVFQITQNEGNDFSEKKFDVEIVGVALCDEKPSEEKVLEIAKEIKAHSVAILN